MNTNVLDRCIHSRTIASILTCALFLSFGLHALQIEHAHSGVHTSHHDTHEKNLLILGEHMHGSDKKLFLFIGAVAISVWGFLDGGGSIWSWLHALSLREYLTLTQKNKEQYKFLEYLDRLFGRGILHSKAY